jgi:hypothetical protein
MKFDLTPLAIDAIIFTLEYNTLPAQPLDALPHLTDWLSFVFLSKMQSSDPEYFLNQSPRRN